MATSILDVAREANVAPSTVSLVVNGKPNVSAQTRQEVKAAIKRLKYKPRKAKRISRVAVVYTQNMIVNGMLAEYCRQWIAGLRQGLQTAQAQMNIYAGTSHVDQDLVFTQSLEHGECDGVIIMGAYPKHGYLERVLASKVPLVAFARAPEHAQFSAVCVDYHNLGTQVARILVQRGHQKLAIITGGQDSYPVRTVRAGFFDALTNLDAQVVHDLTAASGPLEDAYFDDQLEKLLSTGVTALFTGDPAALKFLHAMERRNLTPGIDLTLMGIDDMGLRSNKGLRITSMGYDKHIMGQIAGQMMLQLIEMGDHISHQFTTVQPYLVQGDTLGPPRQA